MDTITSITADFHARIERAERDLQSTKRRVEKTEAATRELRESVAKLQRIVGEAEARNPCLDITNTAFDRQADPCTFWCGAATTVSTEEFKTAPTAWLRDANVTFEQISSTAQDWTRSTASPSRAARWWRNPEHGDFTKRCDRDVIGAHSSSPEMVAQQ
eukprot:7695338-Pyramimonas_sp.AAC.1